MKTLVVVAHLDDETFGMGGTLIKLCKDNPADVRIVSFCTGRDQQNSINRIDAFKKVQAKLQCQIGVYDNYDMELEEILTKHLTAVVEQELEKFNPDVVYTVSENDLHQDHRIVSHVTKIACRPERANVKELYEFEIPECQPYTSTYYDTTVNISDVITDKTELCMYYESENLPSISHIEKFKTIFRRLC